MLLYYIEGNLYNKAERLRQGLTAERIKAMEYKYGMRLRGFAPMCQPMKGLIKREDDTSGRYHDILIYDRELTERELKDYELDKLE